MSISLNELNEIVKSRNIEYWIEVYKPESKVSNTYTLKRKDCDIAFGVATLWDINNDRWGQEVSFFTSRQFNWNSGEPLVCSINNSEGYYIIENSWTFKTNDADAIMRMVILCIKFNGLTKYYFVRNNIIYRATHLLEKIFLCLKQRRC